VSKVEEVRIVECECAKEDLTFDDKYYIGEEVGMRACSIDTCIDVPWVQTGHGSYATVFTARNKVRILDDGHACIPLVNMCIICLVPQMTDKAYAVKVFNKKCIKGDDVEALGREASAQAPTVMYI
jgi:hypothetical protein